MRNMGTTLSSDVNAVTSALRNLTTEATNTNQPIIEYFSVFGESVTRYTSEILSGLDALAIKKEASESLVLENFQSLSDNLTTVLSVGFKQLLSLSSSMSNDAFFKADSIPSKLQYFSNHADNAADILAVSNHSQYAAFQLLNEYTPLSTQLSESSKRTQSLQSKLTALESMQQHTLMDRTQITTEELSETVAYTSILNERHLNNPAWVEYVSLNISSRVSDGEDNAMSVFNNETLSLLLSPESVFSVTSANRQALQRTITVQTQSTNYRLHKLLELKQLRSKFEAFDAAN